MPLRDTDRELPGTAAPAVSDSDEIEVALWEMLYRDPLFECRLILSSLPPGVPFTQVEAHRIFLRLASGLTAEQAESNLPALWAPGSAVSPSDRVTVVQALDAALRWLPEQVEFQRLLGALMADDDTESHPDVFGRAVVARVDQSLRSEADQRLGQEGSLFTDAELRDALIQNLAEMIGGSHRGFAGALLDTVTAPLQGLALWGGSLLGQAHRRTWMQGVSIVAGDVLVYQSRGQAIRDFIRERIRRTQAEILLAHSLGGIACVDLLIEQPEPSVKLLVTAGSQAPYLLEIGALHSLSLDAAVIPEERLPGRFPRWLNLYDPRDFLSFIGEPLFGKRIEDVPVNGRQPFPQSHSAYWSNRASWEAVGARL